ncbi:LysR family transcriptional regulator [Gordonia sp. OPL2]|uniref:LysR family transcriptional regulator n=1 Tax=Gordonia sp. OPL2 TaxID=2486274 RepID=UPI001655F52B|nr:LysR family transcriptional regulator [Gordonia sp. OPL2]ROZ85489.1 LysR family transcriptional regulator [Gordonia sp. OPL2]
MDLVRHLRFFVAVAEEGHFGDAAARLAMTQPPVSQGLRRLEGELGIQLIRRTSRGAELTSAGRELLPRARLLVDDATRLTAEARRLAERDEALRWGAIPHLGTHLTALCAQRISTGTPAQDMVTDSASGLVAAVVAGTLDLAIVDHPCVIGAVTADAVVRLPRWVVVPAAHLAATAPRPRIRHLGDLTACLPPRAWNPPAHDQLLDGFRELGLDPTVHPVDSEPELVAAVAGGSAFGLTVHPASVHAVPGIRCVNMAPDLTSLRLRVIHKNSEHAETAAVITAALWKYAAQAGDDS